MRHKLLLLATCFSAILLFALNNSLSGFKQDTFTEIGRATKQPTISEEPVKDEQNMSAMKSGKTPRDMILNWQQLPKTGHCSRFDAGPSRGDEYPEILEKTVFEGRKYIFVMGLEGTGHHMFPDFLKECSNCISPPAIAHFALSIDDNNKGLFGSNIDRKYVLSLLNLLNSKQDLLRKGSNKTTFINTMSRNWVQGEGSYPNFRGRCTKFKYPDVRILAEIFENYRIDFRVLVLVRSAVKILLSTTVHRPFGSWTKMAPMYSTLLSSVMLDNQINRLDRRFLRCLDYDNLPEVHEDLGAFLGVDNNDFQFGRAIAEHFRVKENNTKYNDEVKKYTAKDTQKKYLETQKRIDQLKEICQTFEPGT